MSVGAPVRAPPRPVSPSKTAIPRRGSKPLNPFPRSRSCSSTRALRATAVANRTPIENPFPRSRSCSSTRALTATAVTTRTHLANLDRLLQKQSPASAPADAAPEVKVSATINGRGNRFLNALNLPAIFPFSRAAAAEEISLSPRSMTHLQRLLSDPARPSPRTTIAPRWRQYHGAGDWAGLLDPLDSNLRRELVRCGDLVQAAYHAFHSDPSLRPDQHRAVPLPDRSYRVTRGLYATASVELPRWVAGFAPWMTERSSWIGYVAVCDSEREIQRMGRRDIVISLRGTATCLEWAENLRCGLVPIDEKHAAGTATAAPKVECGFWSLYKTPGAQLPSLSAAVVGEVKRLVELYKGEELSITVTGHSLGAALAVLVADELSASLPRAPPIAVFSFGGPRVGNRGFAERVERRGVKVLRVVNAKDMVTRVPVAPPRVLGRRIDGYADVGMELQVDSAVSPYLRPDADPACCHDLEAYLHLVDGFLGTHCPFRSNAKRSLARLLDQQGSNMKKLYVTKARSLVVDTAAAAGVARSIVPLPSPSG